MTLFDLVKHLRESILDDTGGVGVNWEDVTEDDIDNYQLRWSNEELSRFIAEAQRKAARNALMIRKSEETDFDIAVVAGTAQYIYNSKIVRIKSVESDSNGKHLRPAEYEQIEGIRNWRTKEGTPEYFIVDRNAKTIRLYPKPTEDDTLYLTYNRLPLVDPTWDLPDAELELPEEYQLDMLDYAAHMAYMKDEANSLDAQRAITFLQKFTANFGEVSAYAEERRRRSAGRTIRYGGL